MRRAVATRYTRVWRHDFIQMVTLLILLISSMVVAIGLGTTFSLVYPRVEIDFSLAFLFVLLGLLLVLAAWGVWQVIRRSKT